MYTELCILQDQSYIQTNAAPKKGQICSFTQQVLLFPLKGPKKVPEMPEYVGNSITAWGWILAHSWLWH